VVDMNQLLSGLRYQISINHIMLKLDFKSIMLCVEVFGTQVES